jgi:hypothetical protein
MLALADCWPHYLVVAHAILILFVVLDVPRCAKERPGVCLGETNSR